MPDNIIVARFQTLQSFWNKCKARAAVEGNGKFMTVDGFINRKLEAAIAEAEGIPWTQTEDFKQQARAFCKKEGWTEPEK